MKLMLFFCLFLFSILMHSQPTHQEKMVALTFDDGPNTNTTLQVIEKLKKYNICTSFFVIGNYITPETEDVLKLAYNMGYDVQNHSLTHPHMTTLSKDEITQEIQATSHKITNAIKKEPIFFRPPYLDADSAMHQFTDLSFIGGISSQDWDPAVDIQQRSDLILQQVNNGSIILLHDTDGNQNTVEALDLLIPALIQRGYSFVTITQLFSKAKITPQRGTIYNNVYQ